MNGGDGGCRGDVGHTPPSDHLLLTDDHDHHNHDDAEQNGPRHSAPYHVDVHATTKAVSSKSTIIIPLVLYFIDVYS